MVIMKNFIKTMENPAARVDKCISTKVETRVISNRKFLRTVIRDVEYCGRQGIGTMATFSTVISIKGTSKNYF